MEHRPHLQTALCQLKSREDGDRERATLKPNGLPGKHTCFTATGRPVRKAPKSHKRFITPMDGRGEGKPKQLRRTTAPVGSPAKACFPATARLLQMKPFSSSAPATVLNLGMFVTLAALPNLLYNSPDHPDPEMTKLSGFLQLTAFAQNWRCQVAARNVEDIHITKVLSSPKPSFAFQ